MTSEELELNATSPIKEEDETEDEDSGLGIQIVFNPIRLPPRQRPIQMRASNVAKWGIMLETAPSVEGMLSKITNSMREPQPSKET